MKTHKLNCDNCFNFETINKKSLTNHRRWCLGLLDFRNAPMYGKKQTKESIEKTRQANLGHIGWNKGLKHSSYTIAKMSQIKMGSNNPYWKGDNVGYAALHNWIRRRLLKPERCPLCEVSAPYDLANISQEYKRDITDWEWLCRRCHMLKDGRLSKLHPDHAYS